MVQKSMRMWGIEDNKAIPSDMVREQDFILQVRRLHRLGTNSLVLNIKLNDAEPEEIGSLETASHRLEAFARELKGHFFEMSNGDAFLVWPESDHSQTALLIKGAATVALTENKRPEINELQEKLVKTYHLPNDYAPLREQLNVYIEISRQAAVTGDAESPEQLLHSSVAQGPLTTWSVNQIQNLLAKIELRSFVQTQWVYEHKKDGAWAPLFEEYSINLETLRQKHFPKLDLSGPNHLFLELCETLDQHLLTELTRDIPSILGKAIHFNLSIHSVMGSIFAQFAHEVPRAEHAHIGFELHRGDLFQNFAASLSAIETLRHEGFKVTLDDVTPDMLSFINFGRFDVEYIKINVARVYAAQLDNVAVREALKGIPKERIIFFHCDSEQALAIGLELGITKFQGWFLDDKFKKS